LTAALLRNDIIMKQPKSEVKVGITVLLAIACLIFGIMWGKQVSLTAGNYTVYARFADISGMMLGASVLVNGINSGKVVDFELEQDGVIVRMELKSSVTLFDDARFIVASPELMGGKLISIIPGVSGNTPPENHIFEGDSGSGMNDLMESSSELIYDVKRLLGVLEKTIENINKTAGDPRVQEALASSINNLDETTEITRDLIKLNEDKFNQIMDNLAKSTEIIHILIEEHRDKIDSAATGFEQFASTLNEFSEQLNLIAGKLQDDEGTLGMLINDADFASMLKQTVSDLDSLVNQIKEEGIQTNISIFGKKKR